MFKRLILGKKGFTLFELMLVVTIIGLMLAVILPRAQRAQYEAKISLVRQNASEVGSYVVQWAQKQVHALHPKSSESVADFIMGTTTGENINLQSTESGLVNHYTGNPIFKGVKDIINPDSPIRNPFNQVSIFDRLNDDPQTPGGQPGLLYLASAFDGGKTETARAFKNLYFIFTGMNHSWYGSIHTKNLNGISRGIFVARFSCPDSVPDQTNLSELPPQ